MPIHYESRNDHIVVITIDRPEARNALDMYHFRDLAQSWRRFKDDADAWVAVITGVGDAFMAGADLKTYIPQVTKLQKEIAAGDVRRDGTSPRSVRRRRHDRAPAPPVGVPRGHGVPAHRRALPCVARS